MSENIDETKNTDIKVVSQDEKSVTVELDGKVLSFAKNIKAEVDENRVYDPDMDIDVSKLLKKDS